MRATIYPALEGAFATVSTPSSSIGKPPVQEQPPPVDGERPAAWSSPSERGDHTSATTTHQPRTKSSTLGAWTRSALRDLDYAGAVFVWSIVAFTILVIGVSVTASLLVLIIGIFVWIGFAYVQRWTTWVDRQLAGWQRHEPIHAVYRRPTAPGLMPLLKTITTDPQTWKDMAWLAVTSIAGFTLGLAALTAAGIVLAYLSMPIWYWAIADPLDLYGLTNLGVVTIDTLSEALAMTAIGLALTPLALLLARGCARAHAALAARILSPSPGAEPGER